MKILRKYALRELLHPFLLSLLFFTFVFFVGNLFKLADLLVNKGVGLLDILKILFLLMPSLLSYVIPTSALTAVLLVFGGFAQNNEITAMKASGVNFFLVALPVLLASFLISLFCLFVDDQVQGEASFAYRQAAKELLLKRPLAYLEAGKFVKDFQDYIILTQKIEKNKLYGITIYQPQEGGKSTRTIIAESGEILSSPDDKTLTLRLYNGTSDEPNPEDPSVFYKLNFKTFELPAIHLGKGDPKSKIGKKTREMKLDEILYELRHEKPSDKNSKRRRELRAEFHKKISFSMATFIFTLIGLPLAVVTRRGEAVVSFSLSMAIVAIYYSLFVWGRALAVEGNIPPFIALWMPNVLMGGCGIYLIKKVLSR